MCQLGQNEIAKEMLEVAFKLDPGMRVMALDDEDLQQFQRRPIHLAILMNETSVTVYGRQISKSGTEAGGTEAGGTETGENQHGQQAKE